MKGRAKAWKVELVMGGGLACLARAMGAFNAKFLIDKLLGWP